MPWSRPRARASRSRSIRAGKIVDASELTALIQEMGQQAFRAGTAMGRIKEPDMIGDFIASQWFLWDAQSSLERPAEGVVVGQTWRSQLSVPTPMVMRQRANVVYKLEEVRQDVGRAWPAMSDHDASLSMQSRMPSAAKGKMPSPREDRADALATPGDATGRSRSSRAPTRRRTRRRQAGRFLIPGGFR